MAGQVAFMKMAALQLAQYAIRVNAVCPGSIDNNIGDNTYKSDAIKEVKSPWSFRTAVIRRSKLPASRSR